MLNLRQIAAISFPLTAAAILVSGALTGPHTSDLIDSGPAPQLQTSTPLHAPAIPGSTSVAAFVIDNPASSSRTSHLSMQAENTTGADLVGQLAATAWVPTTPGCDTRVGTTALAQTVQLADVALPARSRTRVCVAVTLNRAAGNELQGAGASLRLTAQTT